MKAFFDMFNSEQKIKLARGHKKWRKYFYNRTPKDIGISPNEKDRVFGVLIDSVELDGVTQSYSAISLTAFLNGELTCQSLKRMVILDASLLKEREDIFSAVQRLVEIAQSLLDSAVKTKDYSLPDLDNVRFFLITTSGTRLIERHHKEIDGGDNRLKEMFEWFSYIRKYAEDEHAETNNERDSAISQKGKTQLKKTRSATQE